MENREEVCEDTLAEKEIGNVCNVHRYHLILRELEHKFKVKNV